MAVPLFVLNVSAGYSLDDSGDGRLFLAYHEIDGATGEHPLAFIDNGTGTGDTLNLVNWPHDEEAGVPVQFMASVSGNTNVGQIVTKSNGAALNVA